MSTKIIVTMSDSFRRPETKVWVDECCVQCTYLNGDYKFTDERIDYPFEEMYAAIFSAFNLFDMCEKLFIEVSFNFADGTILINCSVPDDRGFPLAKIDTWHGVFIQQLII